MVEYQTELSEAISSTPEPSEVDPDDRRADEDVPAGSEYAY
ncbi:hypothetical protein CASFOL_041564 [Castilleja foliolosa]|uniref:Uncharacterized protein n=1 Tax=Castilleja foliolosa TaxID=1961234 RepID=A0ABD3BBA1_9LAMI